MCGEQTGFGFPRAARTDARRTLLATLRPGPRRARLTAAGFVAAARTHSHASANLGTFLHATKPRASGYQHNRKETRHG
jgi:hypothetical protein